MPTIILDDSVHVLDNAPARREQTAGRIASVNVSAGGVPKFPIHEAQLGARGLVGDTQRNRSHGGPTRALCLYSLECIQALQNEGHPIVPGSTGENLTLEGIDWTQLAPGLRLALGDAEVEITAYTMPCGVIRRSFSDDNSQRISQSEHPGWSRVYAKVITEGTLRVGDAARILAATRSAE